MARRGDGALRLAAPRPERAPRTNLPGVQAEVQAAFERYEAALRAHDVEELNRWFWDHPATVRFGPAESGYGARAIRAQRRRARPVPAGRRLQRTVIATFGRDLAAVSTEFRSPGSRRLGRQTQTWVRLGGQWRIVAAHVSLVPASSPVRRR